MKKINIFKKALNINSLYDLYLLADKNPLESKFLEVELGSFKIQLESINVEPEYSKLSVDVNNETFQLQTHHKINSEKNSPVLSDKDIYIRKNDKLSLASICALQFFSSTFPYSDMRVETLKTNLKDYFANESALQHYFNKAINSGPNSLYSAQTSEDIVSEAVNLINSPMTPEHYKFSLLRQLYLGLDAASSSDIPAQFCASVIEHLDFTRLSSSDLMSFLMPPMTENSNEEFIVSMLVLIEESLQALKNEPDFSPEKSFVLNFFQTNNEFLTPGVSAASKVLSGISGEKNSTPSVFDNLIQGSYSKNKFVKFLSIVKDSAIFIPRFIGSTLSYSLGKKLAPSKLKSFLSLYNIFPTEEGTSKTPSINKVPYNALEILSNHVLYRNKSLFSTEFQKKIVDVAFFNGQSPLFQKALEQKNYKLNYELQSIKDKKELEVGLSKPSALNSNRANKI